MKKLRLKMVALVATMMMANVKVSAQLNDSISMDTTVWVSRCATPSTPRRASTRALVPDRLSANE